ncbi:hypothetical protein L6164_035791 [Bauhinia variegata]|uniref:Uncharacterized protein n=1 Tax=Bauhinia variegata TaxID=167791 RepID=A0ACB9KF66_BAUVA|nr:hypothetical protein L6164_035791 [Bauhinia variegata]
MNITCVEICFTASCKARNEASGSPQKDRVVSTQTPFAVEEEPLLVQSVQELAPQASLEFRESSVILIHEGDVLPEVKVVHTEDVPSRRCRSSTRC